jgi:hypothetical protein
LGAEDKKTSGLSAPLWWILLFLVLPERKKKRARRTRRSTRRVFPFEGSSFACRCTDRVAPSCAPSREGSVLLGVLLSERLTGLLGSPSPAATSTFRPCPAVSLRSPSTSDLRLGLHPPASFPPPPECYGLRPARRVQNRLATTLDQRTPPVGSSPSSRHQPAASTIAQGIPTPRSRSLLDVSRVLEGLLRLQPLRAYFIPLPRPGFALQGFVPRCGAVPGFPGRVMPSCR